MPLALVPPATLYTPTPMSPGAARVCVDSLIQKFRPKRSRHVSGFDTGDNPNSGILWPIRWRLPRIDGVLARNDYSMTIERDENGCDTNLLHRFAEIAEAHRLDRLGMTTTTCFDIEPQLLSPRQQLEYSPVFGLGVATRYHKLMPEKHGYSVFFNLPWEEHLHLERSERFELLSRFAEASGTGLKIKSDSYFEGRVPVKSFADNLYTYRQTRMEYTDPKGLPEFLEIGGFESLDEAWTVFLRVLLSFEVYNPVTKCSCVGPPTIYGQLRDRFNDLALGWGFSNVCRLDPEIDPYADPRELPEDAPRWVPVFQWECGEWKHVVMSMLRFPDGLRLEFASNYANIDWLRKEVAKAAPNMEVEQVLAPGSPGSQYDF